MVLSAKGHVILGSLLGFAVIGLWITWLPDWLATALGISSDVDRFTLGIRCAVVLQLPLIVGILVVGQQRFWSPRHADGSAPEIGSTLEINHRFLTNTLEQSALATVGLLALAMTVPAERLGLVPALTALFLVGRVLFWMAYLVNPYARAFGLVLTFGPTVGVYVYLIWTFVRGA